MKSILGRPIYTNFEGELEFFTLFAAETFKNTTLNIISGAIKSMIIHLFCTLMILALSLLLSVANKLVLIILSNI